MDKPCIRFTISWPLDAGDWATQMTLEALREASILQTQDGIECIDREAVDRLVSAVSAELAQLDEEEVAQ